MTADLTKEVWVDNSLEDMQAGAPPRRKATPLEAYQWVTREMLDLRVANKDKPDDDGEDRYLEWLDDLWHNQLTEADQEAVEAACIVEEYLVPHDEKDVYRDNHGVKRWKTTKTLVEALWDNKNRD